MKIKYLTAAVLGLVVLLHSSGPPSSAAEKGDVYESLDLFSWAFEQARRQYVDEIGDRDLIEAAIDGMLQSLDPHSQYLSPKDYSEMRTQTRGEFGGLGIEVTMESGFVKVVSPIEGTPADEAGIEAGDYITHLDGEPVQGLKLNEAVEKMRGPIGTSLVLTIIREGRDSFEVTLTRDRIKVRSVWSRLEQGDIGYLRIAQFNEQTQPGLKEAFKLLDKEAKENLTGYVLDLRNNPGGLLDQAILVADSFLDRGLILSTRGRNGTSVQDFRAHKGDQANGLPLVVLINGGSASASEIVAGALQDHKRAIVLGTGSFGKGSVQSLLEFSRTGAAIKLTTQRYYTPSGRSIQAKGIQPDIVVEQARLETVERKYRHEVDLRNALESEEVGVEAEMTGEAGYEHPQDYQLVRALDLIRALSLYNERQAG